MGELPFELEGASLVESWSNDTWLTNEVVLRICWRGDRTRLHRERQVLEALPPSVPHAEVLGYGAWEDGSWIALRRIPGDRLDLVWDALTLEQRRRAVRTMGELRRSLHQWEPPLELREALAAGTSSTNKTPDEIAGSMIVPWPRDRWTPLLESSARLFGPHQDVHDALLRRSEALGIRVLDGEFEGSTVVHGDAHAANFLCEQGEVVALLDFEWARLGPADLDLEAPCRDDPQIDAAIDDGAVNANDVFVLSGMRDGYPEVFEHAHLTERLWLYQLCHELRSLCVNVSDQVGDERLKRLRSIATHPWVRFNA